MMQPRIRKERDRVLTQAFVRCRQFDACMRMTARTMHKLRYHEATMHRGTAWVLGETYR